MCSEQSLKKRLCAPLCSTASDEPVEPPWKKSSASKMNLIFGGKPVFFGKKTPTFWFRTPCTFSLEQRLQDGSQLRATMDPEERCWTARLAISDVCCLSCCTLVFPLADFSVSHSARRARDVRRQPIALQPAEGKRRRTGSGSQCNTRRPGYLSLVSAFTSVS